MAANETARASGERDAGRVRPIEAGASTPSILAYGALAAALRAQLAARFPQRCHLRGGKLVKSPPPDSLPAEPIGLYPIAPGEDACRVGVLDLDNHGDPPLPWDHVTRTASPVVEHLRALGHYPMPFRSTGGKGVHLWLVWDTPQKAAAVRALLSNALEACGLSVGAGGIAAGECEVFPKQDAVPADGFGSSITLPLAGASVALDSSDLRPLDGVPTLVSSVNLDATARPPEPARDEPADWNPETIRSALAAVPPDEYGTWIDVLRALLGGAVRAKQDPDGEAQELAREWSRKSNKHEERDFKQKWERGFRKERAGRGRSLGTLYWLAERHGWEPPARPREIERIKVQMSSPRRFFVHLRGHDEPVEMESSELASPQKFRTAMIERALLVVRPPKDGELARLLRDAERIEVDESATFDGRFKEHLHEFIGEHGSQDRAELRVGRAWLDHKKSVAWFRWHDFEQWLRRRRVYEFDQSKALAVVRRLGGDSKAFNLGAAKDGEHYGHCRAWCVPYREQPTPEPDAAEVPETEMGHETAEARSKALRKHHATKR